jgi:tRNA threonylcarbamoyladenosine modification (KEOPS) complex Cgi121 subunit
LSREARCYRFSGQAAPQELARELRTSFPGLVVQAVHEAAVENERLVELVAEQTLEAEKAGCLLAKKPEVDLLLRLGATTQIERAIREVGVRRGCGFVLIAAGEEPEMRRFESERAAGWERIPRRQLEGEDMKRVEVAALLNAQKA